MYKKGPSGEKPEGQRRKEGSGGNYFLLALTIWAAK